MAFIGSGSAKLILFGEHAVLHGHPAVGTSLPGQLTVRWTPGPTPLKLDCPEEYQQAILLAFQRIAACFGLTDATGTPEPTVAGRQTLPGGLLEFESDIPVSSGFGSSGAVCIALARAVAAYVRSLDNAPSVAEPAGKNKAGTDQHPSPVDSTIWAAAHNGEQVFHGRPSGVDTGLALWRRLCLFTLQPQALPSVGFLPSTGIKLVFGTVPREASCATSVAAIGKAMAIGDTGVSAAMTELGRLSAQAAALLSLQSPSAAALGSLADTAMEVLGTLGLSTPAMDTILEAGLAAGATGGKLSGGGAGGAFWLACPGENDAIRIQTAVIEEARRLELPGEAFTGVITI